MDETLQKIYSLLNDTRIKRNNLKETIKNLEDGAKELKRKNKVALQALTISQQVAKKTQQVLEEKLSSLVTMSLASVFDDIYELQLEYGIKYNKTEARLWFVENGKKRDPMTGTGGGVKDIASLGLRCTALALQGNKNRPILILDEPFRFINDPSRNLHKKAAELLKTLSAELGLQIIMVSQVPELQEIADNLIKVELDNNRISKIKYVKGV